MNVQAGLNLHCVHVSECMLSDVAAHFCMNKLCRYCSGASKGITYCPFNISWKDVFCLAFYFK